MYWGDVLVYINLIHMRVKNILYIQYPSILLDMFRFPCFFESSDWHVNHGNFGLTPRILIYNWAVWGIFSGTNLSKIHPMTPGSLGYRLLHSLKLTASLHLKLAIRKGNVFSNHPFSESIIVSGRVGIFFFLSVFCLVWLILMGDVAGNKTSDFYFPGPSNE